MKKFIVIMIILIIFFPIMPSLSQDKKIRLITNETLIEEITAQEDNAKDDNDDTPAILDKEKMSEYEWIMDGTPIFSPDKKRSALVAMQSGKIFAVVDGAKGKEYYDIGSIPLFSADSKHVAYVATDGDKWFAIIDGTESMAYDGIGKTPVFSPDGERVFYVAKRGNGKSCAVVDGVEGKEYDGVFEPKFSPDSKRLVYTAWNDGKAFPVIDGVEDKGNYSKLYPIIFSPDSKRLACVADNDRKQFLVVDGVESKEGYDSVFNVTFSPDSKKIAYGAERDRKCFVVLRGPTYRIERGGEMIAIATDKVLDEDQYDKIFSITFSPDNEHVIYPIQKDDKCFVVVDGIKGEQYDSIAGIIKFDPQKSSIFSFFASRDKKNYRMDVEIVEE